jgi:hypothetical protein
MRAKSDYRNRNGDFSWNCSNSSNAKKRRFSCKAAYRQISKRSREPRKIGIRSQVFGQLNKAVFGG